MDEEILNRALMNDLVVKKVFSYLHQRNLKCCRQVCSQWNASSKNHFIKSSVCVINSYYLDSNTMQNFVKIFPNAKRLKFKNFCLRGVFILAEFETFFKDWNFMKELKLKEIRLFISDNIELERYNMSLLSKLHLTALHIQNMNSPMRKTILVVPLTSIGAIKSLFLHPTFVEYDGQIAPSELIVTSVFTGHKNDHTWGANDIVGLNDYIDVSNLKEIDFSDLETSTYRIDLRHCLKLEYLCFYNAKIIGWHNNLTLRRLFICKVALDLSYLPPSVVELNITHETELSNSANVQLINLKSLSFREEFLYFAQCPNLVHVTTKNSNFDLDTLPMSVRTMAVWANCKFVGERAVQLDKLVFIESRCTFSIEFWETILKAIDRLNPVVVILGIDCGGTIHNRCPGELDCLFEIAQKQMKKDGGAFVLMRTGCRFTRIRAIPERGSSGRPLSFQCKHEYHEYKDLFSRRIGETEYVELTGTL